jgi:hypothetical protein
MLLKLNAWARREPARVSILKCPAYSGMAEAMLEVFPDARLICLSRDPAQVVASSASLVFEQRRIHSDTVDKSAVGPEWLTRTAERQRHLAKVRASNPEVPAFDLHYRAIGTDWRGTLHRLYRFLGLPLTAEVKGRMERFLSRAKAHRGHRYSLEDYGLTDEAVCQAFTPTAARTPYEAAAGAFLEEPASAFS